MALGAVTMAPGPTTQEVLMGERLAVPPAAEDQSEAEPLVDGELLVEEVSIDGMCGVY
jgi:mycofactocin precursor